MGLNVIRDSDKPVVLVVQRPSGPYRRLVVDLDPSDELEPALQAVRRFAPRADLHSHVAALGASSTHTSGACPGALDPLLDCVRQHGADLLVLDADKLFAQAYGEPLRLLRKVADARNCDVLFVRHRTALTSR